MAGFRTHVTVSTALGVGYGAAAYYGLNMDWATCAIAGGLTGIAGMLPDLDSPTGQPVREIFGLGAAIAPVLLLKRMNVVLDFVEDATDTDKIVLSHEGLVVIMAACYFAVRFGGAWLLDRLTIHRGMFHSIPAALIAAITALMLCHAPTFNMRLFIAGGVLIGFLSHLILDEIWSVKVGLGGVGLKKSSGTAFKLFSDSAPATFATYVILLGVCYLALQDRAVTDALRDFHFKDRGGVAQSADEDADPVRR